MVITMSTPVKTLLKMFCTFWKSSLSRPHPSRGTETLFTLCSTHQSLMCFTLLVKSSYVGRSLHLFFVIKWKIVLPSSSCVTTHSPAFFPGSLTFSTPYLCWNVTAMPAPYAQSALTQWAKGSCGGLEKISPFLWTTSGIWYGIPSASSASLSWTWVLRSTAVCARDLLGGSHATQEDKWYQVSPFPARRTQCNVLEVTLRGSDHLASFHFLRNFPVWPTRLAGNWFWFIVCSDLLGKIV